MFHTRLFTHHTTGFPKSDSLLISQSTPYTTSLAMSSDLSHLDKDVTEYTDQDVYRLQQYLDTLGDQDDESVAPAEAVDLTAPGEYSVVLDVKTTLGATGDVQNYGLELTPIGQGPGGKGSARGKAKPGRYDGQIKWVGPFQLGQAYGVILRGVLGKLHATWFDKRNPTIKLATFVETGSTGGEGTLAAGLFIFRQH